MPMLVAAIVVVFVAAALTVLLLRGRAGTGRASAASRAVAPSRRRAGRGDRPASAALETSGRSRANGTREAGARVLVRDRGEVAAPQPAVVTEEALGVTRREFFNRGLLAIVGFALVGTGSAALAFLWPSSVSTGFGGQIEVPGLTKILAQIQANKAPFYVPAARTWLQGYPPNALPAAKKVYKPVVYVGMQRGVVALYQRCPHLGCRVPWCQSSQWFECPCHGSKYNAVGEKKAGPAPRGMDRFAIEFHGDNITINTETVIDGPPIGTNTTGQVAEGPLCV